MRKYGSSKDAFFAIGIQLISECGYQNLSVSQLCKAANASNGSFFHHFGSKPRFTGELYLNVLESYQDALVQVVKETSSAKAVISELISTHISWVIENIDEASFLLSHPSTDSLETVKEEIKQLNTQFQSNMSPWYQEQCDKQTITPLPLEVFYFQLIGPAQIICRNWLSNPDSTHPKIHQEHLINCAIKALTTGCNVKVATP